MNLLALALLAAVSISNPPADYGKQLYTQYCATCHGADTRGTDYGPSLQHVGDAAVDFYLMTGRMPAGLTWIEIQHQEHHGAQLDPGKIRAIEQYLSTFVAGGPPIPEVSGGDLAHGRKLYNENCEHCHGVQGEGGALGALAWAPDLRRTSIAQVAEAIRIGPGEMPQFGDKQISAADLDDLSTYVISFDAKGQPRDVPPFRSTGPLPEGAISWMGIALLVVFVFSYWRTGTPPSRRRDAVRPELPVGPPFERKD
jgi:ubiquinol-cytochrome c reductase cytochrome c subunit